MERQRQRRRESQAEDEFPSSPALRARCMWLLDLSGPSPEAPCEQLLLGTLCPGGRRERGPSAGSLLPLVEGLSCWGANSSVLLGGFCFSSDREVPRQVKGSSTEQGGHEEA